MPHPSSFELPYEQIAIYTLYARCRIRLWEWPVQARQRVMLAAMDASDRNGRDVMRAALAQAALVIRECEL